jgi:hypothetical protein
MLRILVILSLTIFAKNLFSQTCLTFEDYERSGLHISTLDSIYAPALGPDPTTAVFADRYEEFFSAWKQLLTDQATHLNNNGYSWGRPTQCYTRIYFNPDGTINTYLFNFRAGQISQQKQDIFKKLTTAFAKEYQLKIDNPAKSKFSQCGPVTYNDVE